MSALLLLLLIHLNLQSIIIDAETIIASQSEYYNKTIQCSATSISPCFIYCEEEHSCSHSLIFCPINRDCIISCGSKSNACNSAIIDARYSSLFELNDCSSGDISTCNGMTIYFPPNDFGEPRSFINTGNNLKHSLIFYAIYGWADIDSSGFIGDYNGFNGTMYCTFWYNINCQFNDKEFSCKNIDDPCNKKSISSISRPITTETTETIFLPFTSTLIDRDLVQQKHIKPKTNYMITSNVGVDHSLWYIIAGLVFCLCLLAIPLMYYVNRHYKYYKKAMNAPKRDNNDNMDIDDIHKGEVVYYSNGGTPSVPSTPSALSTERDDLSPLKPDGNSTVITINRQQKQNSMSTISESHETFPQITDIKPSQSHLDDIKPTLSNLGDLDVLSPKTNNNNNTPHNTVASNDGDSAIGLYGSNATRTKSKCSNLSKITSSHSGHPGIHSSDSSNTHNMFINDVESDSNTLYIDKCCTNHIITTHSTLRSSEHVPISETEEDESSETSQETTEESDKLTFKVNSDITGDNMSNDTWISFYRNDLYHGNDEVKALNNNNYVD